MFQASFLAKVLVPVCFAGFTMGVAQSAPATVKPAAVQETLSLPGPVNIPGVSDSYTSGVVSGITLQLVRDTTTDNKPVTYWNLSFQYYNGSFRWENYQELDIDFVDEFGVVLQKRVIAVATPSTACHYGAPVTSTDHGMIDFNFVGHNLHLAASGISANPDHKDHKC